jgi:hypothetical protein
MRLNNVCFSRLRPTGVEIKNLPGDGGRSLTFQLWMEIGSSSPDVWTSRLVPQGPSKDNETRE